MSRYAVIPIMNKDNLQLAYSISWKIRRKENANDSNGSLYHAVEEKTFSAGQVAEMANNQAILFNALAEINLWIVEYGILNPRMQNT